MTAPRRRVLITGATGGVGLALVDGLRDKYELIQHGRTPKTPEQETALREAGVRRVVFASSNHAMGMYDRDEQWPVYPTDLPRGDSLYGVSKIFGEALGRFYHDEHGLDVISLRIGWMTEDPTEADEEILRAMWLSPGDAVRVVRAAIESETRCGVYYAISDNPDRRWDITNTMLELGYRPQDAWTDLPGQSETVVEGGERTPDSWPRGV